jgi:hypothetical protein
MNLEGTIIGAALSAPWAGRTGGANPGASVRDRGAYPPASRAGRPGVAEIGRVARHQPPAAPRRPRES